MSVAVFATARAELVIAEPEPAGDTIIGDGTPASCTEQALFNALQHSGAITFNCGAAPYTLTISALKQVANATSLDGGGRVTLSGGGIAPLFQVFASATLTLTNVTLANARGSGGITAIQNFGGLYLFNTRFENNDAGANDGGAISNYGDVSIQGSVFFNNRAGTNRKGGAVYVASGTASIARSQFISNSGFYAGGLAVDGGDVKVSETAFRQNAGFDGGGMFVAGNVTSTIVASEFTSNTAFYGAGMEIQGAVMMSNTTLAGNVAQNDGGGIWFLNTTGTSQISSMTMVGNRAVNGAALNYNGGSATIKNTVIVGAPSTVTDNCVGAALDNGNVSTDASCGSALVIADVKLGAVTNGAYTRYYIPQANSPLIDTGLSCPSTDQRGVSRPYGLRCDIGSIEVAPPAKVLLPIATRAGGFQGTAEIEPNNSSGEANGPLASGVAYTGAPNDANDYFRFVVPKAGPVTIALTGHSGEAVNRLQLQLRDAGDQQITYVFAAPFTISVPNLAPGTYYVRVFFAAPGPYASAPPYTLVVTYPAP